MLIELHIARIKEEPKICHIVSVLTHSLANLSANTCAITPDMLKSWVKLTDLGILLPIEKISMPSSLDELVQQATKFQAWVAEESHRQAAPEAGGDK